MLDLHHYSRARIEAQMIGRAHVHHPIGDFQPFDVFQAFTQRAAKLFRARLRGL